MSNCSQLPSMAVGNVTTNVNDHFNQSAGHSLTIFMPKFSLQTVTFVSSTVIIPLFCLLGSIGNILSLVVLFNQRMRNQTNYVLAALSVSDTLFLLHCLIYTGVNIYRNINPVEGETLNAHVYPIVAVYGSVVTARITSCLTLLLCAERFVAVFLPMQAKTLCSKRNTGIAIAVIYLATILAFIPLSLKYEPSQYIHANVTVTTMNTTELYKRNTYFYSVYGTMLNIIFRFAPLMIIPILNTLMISAVHRTWRQRRRMSKQESNNDFRLTSRNGKHCSSTDQYHITIMLLAVSFVFLICILPGAINSIMTHVLDQYSRIGKLKNLYTCISSVTFLLETINSSINFIIYMALSRKFRLLYKEIFCCGHGSYYQQISVSSINFRTRHGRAHELELFERGTVSDIGPLMGSSLRRQVLRQNWRKGIHSDGSGSANEMASSFVSRTYYRNNFTNYERKRRQYQNDSIRSLLHHRFGKLDSCAVLDNGNGTRRIFNGVDTTCKEKMCKCMFERSHDL